MSHFDGKTYINTGGMDRQTEMKRHTTHWVDSSPGRLECQLYSWMTARNIQPTVLCVQTRCEKARHNPQSDPLI